MIRHVVLLQVSDAISHTQVDEVLERLEANAMATPGIIAFSGGEKLTDSWMGQGFTHCYTIDFADETARDIYLDRLDQDETCWKLSDIMVGGLGGILSINLDITDIRFADDVRLEKDMK